MMPDKLAANWALKRYWRIGLEIRRPHSHHRQPRRCEGWIQSMGTALRRQPRRRVRHSGSGLRRGSGGAERAAGIARSRKAVRANMTAYMQYLKGAHLLKRRRPVDVQRAFEYFREAI